MRGDIIKHSKRVLVTFTEEQWKFIDSLRGSMGNADADIVRNIVISWLSEKSFISSSAKIRLFEER